MSDFLYFQLMKEEKKHAYTGYSYAATKLELAQIKERFAEIISQHDPIAVRFPELKGEERERLIDLVRYVVIGRFKESLLATAKNGSSLVKLESEK